MSDDRKLRELENAARQSGNPETWLNLLNYKRRLGLPYFNVPNKTLDYWDSIIWEGDERHLAGPYDIYYTSVKPYLFTVKFGFGPGDLLSFPLLPTTKEKSGLWRYLYDIAIENELVNSYEDYALFQEAQEDQTTFFPQTNYFTPTEDFIWLNSIYWDGGSGNHPAPGEYDLYLYLSNNSSPNSILARNGLLDEHYISTLIMPTTVENIEFWNILYHMAIEAGLIKPLPLYQLISIDENGNEEILNEAYELGNLREERARREYRNPGRKYKILNTKTGEYVSSFTF